MNLRVEGLVSEASWAPRYSIRADLPAKKVSIEYDAVLVQRSGEDWDDVELTLSTAQPMVAANPPIVQPIWVDVYKPPPPAAPVAAEPAFRRSVGGVLSGGAPAEAAKDAEADKRFDVADEMRRVSADAAVAGAGSAVSYKVPRAVTVKTRSDREQRTRVATVDATTEFVYVAQPMLTEAVYLRGRVANKSPYQLLPGPVQVFVGGDFVWPTNLSSIAPGGTTDLFFGIDRSLRAKRTPGGCPTAAPAPC